jgi:hypothetical protein
MPIKKSLALLLVLVTSIAFANNVELSPDHPDKYTVVKGDTLWDIAERFLRDPWRWPDVWYVNPQIENPHLIYPGDVISLTYDKDGRPQLKVSRGRETVKLSPRVRETPLDRAIPTIPLDAIQQFLSRPLVVGEGEMEAAAYVVQSADEHLVAGAGDRIYVRGIPDKQQTRYSIFRPGQVYRNPPVGDEKEGEILGYEAIFVGDANVQRFGDPATLVITSSTRETRIGDRLLPINESEIITHFLPRAPEQEVEGRIIAVLDGVSQIGQHSIVVINKGKADNIQIGHVLAVHRAGEVVLDKVTPDPHDTVKLPDERAGIVMVFRTFDRVSYGLVMSATRALHVLDYVRKPRL